MSESFSHGYALLIGVGKTADSKWSLPVTVNDARAIREVLADKKLCAYDSKHIRILHDAGATRSAVLEGLVWLQVRAQSDPHATVIVYYSGHGILSESSKRYHLFPHDTNTSDIAHSALAATEFTQALRKIPARRLLVMLDCCHAEGMAIAKDANAKRTPGFKLQAVPKNVAGQLKKGEGRAVFSSSRGAQLSWISPDGSLSIFTYHLLEALQGAGNKPGDSEVRLSNLMNHLGWAVPASARKLYDKAQTPFFDAATEDFSVAVLRGGKGLPAQEWGAIQVETPENIRQVVLNINAQIAVDRGVVIGGNVSGSTIITGDQNVVQRGKYNVNIDQAKGLAIGDNARANYRDDDEEGET